MKIALITDTHWGVRNDSPFFYNYFKKCVDEFFIPELRKRGINKIVHLGDLVDRRKYINYMTLTRLRQDFLTPINSEFQMDIIAGNHDTFFKNTNEVNALTELVYGVYENIEVYVDPYESFIGGLPFLYVPWICEDNYQKLMNAIKHTEAQVVFGHLELTGFEMYKGHISTHGYDKNLFDKFDIVCSGHYHHKSDYNSIHYLGAFCEHTWSDYNDPRGFTVYDTETRELEFVQNPFTVFKKVRYDDEGKDASIILDNIEDVKDKIIKIIVSNKTNSYLFDLFVEKLEGQTPAEMQTVEDHLNLNVEGEDEIIANASDTVSLFKSYISQLEFAETKKEELEKTILSLYSEAINIV